MQLIKQSNDFNQEQIIDLKKYWIVTMKAKWKILSFAIFTTLLVAVYISGLTPIYRATSSLIIESNQAKTVAIDPVNAVDSSREDYFVTQFEILKSQSVTEQVIDKLKLADHPEFMDDGEVSSASKLKTYIRSFFPTTEQRTDGDLSLASELKTDVRSFLPKAQQPTDKDNVSSAKVRLISNFQNRLFISPVNNTTLVNIAFEAKDPELAALVANTVGDVYINQEVSAQLKTTKKAAGWLKGRLQELRGQVELSITELQEYRIKEDLIDIESKGVRSIASDELENLTSSYLQAKKERFEAETIQLFISRLRTDDIDSLLSVPEISNHPLIKDIKRLEVEAEQKYSELSFRYGKKHPKLIAAKAELDAVQHNLKRNVDKLVSGFRKELNAATDNERRLKNELEKEKNQFQNVSNKEQGYLKLKREVEANRNLYDTFLARYKEMDITTDLEVTPAHIVDQALVPLAPVRPNKKLIIALGFAASFGFALLLTFIIDALNDTFRTAFEIENELGTHLLGLLPLVKLKHTKSLPLHAYFEDKNWGFSEAVRTIRTGFVLSHVDDEDKIVVVTSSIPGEGKTTTAINIAFSLAPMKKTLLIEGDMRRPSFLSLLDLPPHEPGLSNLISDTATIENVIIHDELSGLDILPAGFIQPNPLELLSSNKFEALLTVLREKYDRIIIDSPPTQAVSDALILAKQADSVIYVVRSETTKKSVVKKGLSRLLAIDTKIDGIVLNLVDMKKTKYEHSDHGYYDYYGYGQESKAKS
ncbi:MAG: succinoglycan biosynthesis transport protein ExoP [Psychromonas sp.]|jgi:succinoglycan biosynthesis transport protein ExoP